MSTFDFFEGEEPKSSERDIAQRLEQSLDFWVEGKEDYPPAIRGVMAEIGDLPDDVQQVVQKIARDKSYPDLEMKRLLWFEDKNGKLDEACAESKEAFRPYAVGADGLVSWTDPNNPLLETPTRHRMIVSDEFAKTNYDQSAEDDIIDDDEDEESISLGIISPKSWKRKITQTLKPWSVKKDGKIVRARSADDLMTTLNVLFSRTKHGWLVCDLFKLKKRRGSFLTYARTFEYQRKNDQAFEFMIELFGAAAEYRARLGKTLREVACLFLEIGEDGEVYLSRATTYPDKIEEAQSANPELKDVVIPIEARINLDNRKPSQIVLKKTGKYYESKLKPLVEKGKKLSTKIDLRSSLTESKRYRFHVKVELDGPLLVGSSGDGLIFQLNDFLKRFANTSLVRIRTQAKRKMEEES